MTRAQDVADLVESISPISAGLEGDGLGLVYGDRDTEVSGVAVCWSPTLAIVKRAASLGCTLHCAQEMGLAVTGAGHCASVDPGMRVMAEWLEGQLLDTRVVFLDSGKPWQVLPVPARSMCRVSKQSTAIADSSLPELRLLTSSSQGTSIRGDGLLATVTERALAHAVHCPFLAGVSRVLARQCRPFPGYPRKVTSSASLGEQM